MNNPLNKPLGFGEVLDLTFRMIKSNFKTMFMIVFWITVPLLAIQAIILMLSGKDFLMSMAAGQSYIDQLLETSDSLTSTALQDELINMFANFFTLFAYPLLAGAIILTIQYKRKGESLTPKTLIKKTFPRYWPLFWSSLLLSIITIAILVPALVILALISGILIATIPILGILMLLLLGFGLFIGVGLLLTRWSLYLPAVLFEKVAPGLSKSFQLTKRQTWKYFGLFIVLFIIVSIISTVLQIPLFFLGDSILFIILTNLISMITSMVFVVGYAVMYFDATARQEATDLKEMINEYDVLDQQ